MKYCIKGNKPRRLKVEEVGDFYRHRTKPLLRLTGNWLKEAGINPNSYVVVTNPEAGVLRITIEPDALVHY
jgi:hypothetical protein